MRFLFVSCQACKHTVNICGAPEEVLNLLGSLESFPCVTPLCRGRMHSVAPARLPAGHYVQVMPVRNFFQAIHGFGSGDGAPASKKRLEELLLSQRVVDVVAESIGQPERVIVKELVLESGVRLHFETSAKGACVYYIEEPKNDPPAESTSCGNHTDREEAGRAPQVVFGGCQAEERSVGECRTPELPDSGGVPAVPEEGDVRPHYVQGRTKPGFD